jgi:ferredoxin
MSAEVYYFTGTGNSLVVARDIAKRIDGKVVSIPSVMDKESIEPDADVLGIVFPAYYMRMPGIVERFVNKLANIQDKYIFAIVTVGGIAGSVLPRLSEAINKRGGNLATGFIVRMPANYIHNADALPLFLQKRMFRSWSKRVDNIAYAVQVRKRGLARMFNPAMTLLFSRHIDEEYLEGGLSPDIDKNFWVDGKCNGCRVCFEICPVRNVKIVDDKPVWQHHCEKCLACIQWCPKQAIQFTNATIKRKRYHHPDAKLSDLLKWNE